VSEPTSIPRAPHTVSKAVIPVAGLGTRFLPATKALPKEMLPVVDKPAIQYVVEEAADAGLDDILIRRAKSAGRPLRSLPLPRVDTGIQG
jgi:UTP--glucose-1-phosphate uridylyltransferase